LYKRKARQLNAQAWRTHNLVFQKEALSEIIQQLERYHHVKIDIAKESLKRCAFTCNFGKTKLDDALKVLQIGMKLQWEKASNNHYIIRDGICQ
jgi:ferric-dicitrate binding protein FerR (iron transport regulator)